MSDAIRLPNGKTVTRARALNRGWIDEDGNITSLAPRPSREQVEVQRRERARQWRESQGLDPLPEDSPEELAALTGRAARKVKPLKPRNVTHEGEPITDKALLDQIEAQTKAIEAVAAYEKKGKSNA